MTGHLGRHKISNTYMTNTQVFTLRMIRKALRRDKLLQNSSQEHHDQNKGSPCIKTFSTEENPLQAPLMEMENSWSSDAIGYPSPESNSFWWVICNKFQKDWKFVTRFKEFRGGKIWYFFRQKQKTSRLAPPAPYLNPPLLSSALKVINTLLCQVSIESLLTCVF